MRRKVFLVFIRRETVVKLGNNGLSSFLMDFNIFEYNLFFRSNFQRDGTQIQHQVKSYRPSAIQMLDI